MNIFTVLTAIYCFTSYDKLTYCKSLWIKVSAKCKCKWKGRCKTVLHSNCRGIQPEKYKFLHFGAITLWHCWNTPKPIAQAHKRHAHPLLFSSHVNKWVLTGITFQSPQRIFTIHTCGYVLEHCRLASFHTLHDSYGCSTPLKSRTERSLLISGSVQFTASLHRRILDRKQIKLCWYYRINWRSIGILRETVVYSKPSAGSGGDVWSVLRQPCKVTASPSGALMGRCLAQGNLDTLTCNLAWLPANPLYLLTHCCPTVTRSWAAKLTVQILVTMYTEPHAGHVPLQGKTACVKAV